MAIIQLGFSGDLNYSVQIGDTIYYVPVDYTGGFVVGSPTKVLIGPISDISVDMVDQGNGAEIPITTLTATINDETEPPSEQSFIFFSKDNTANLASVVGYYSEVQFKNNSRKKAELFASACGIEESSK